LKFLAIQSQIKCPTNQIKFSTLKMRKITKQPFDYYLFLDFEANCLENDESFFREIIEFPFVMVDSSTLKIEKEFKTFVKPTVNKEITKFCTELTGITQVNKSLNST
jgi:inhibitor of KinA sporulation pathway (predicted exonuclease)